MLGQFVFNRTVVIVILLAFISGSSAANPARDTSLPTPLLNFFVSNEGLNSNSGSTETNPKKSLDSISTLLKTAAQATGPVLVALERNSIFREELQPVNKLWLTSYEKSPGGRRPVITGLDVVKDWTLTTGRKTVYQHLLTHSIDLDNPAYSYIMIAEIDTILEKTNAVAAVKYLRLTTGIEACENSPGTYYTPDLRTNPVTVYIHPTSGVPGQTHYRYEATTRRASINGYYFDDANYTNAFLQSSGNGYGMLSGGDRTLARNLTFQGGGTHHFVIKSGTVDSCLFLPGPRGLANRIAGVFYEAEGKENVNRLTNSVFLDIPTPIYTHTNGAVNHKSLTIDNVYAFGDSTDAIQAFSSADTDTTLVANSYAENYRTGWYGQANKISISNTIFRNTNQSAIEILPPKGARTDVNISNVLIKTNGNDANQNGQSGWVAYGVRASYPNINVNISNSIIHGYSTWHQDPQPAILTFDMKGTSKVSKNIFISDVNDNNYMHIMEGNNSNGAGSLTNSVSDNNVFILLRGKGFHWYIGPTNYGGNTVLTLTEWQTLSGQDKHSIVIDLRKNPLGLNAIFKDPANGDWRFSDTDLAATVKAVGAGMTAPPLYYPQRPMITNEDSFFKPGGFASFNAAQSSPNETLLKWNTFNERVFSVFTVEASTDSVNFVSLDTLQAKKEGADYTYEYLHKHTVRAKSFYRLKITRNDDKVLYSPVIAVSTSIREGLQMAAFPNPFQNTITIEHPSRAGAVISVYDVGGHLVQTIPVSEGMLRTRLPLPRLQKGLYIIRWSAGKEAMTTMVLK